MESVHHPRRAQLEAGLEQILRAPPDRGVLEMIVRRPQVGAREVLDAADLHRELGLVGDSWSRRPSSRTADGSPHPEMQLNLMSSRVIEAVAGQRARWPLAGDQLFVDLDLTPENLPAGTRLAIGDGGAVIAVTAQPHTGCRKFAERFGLDALTFVNSGRGKRLRLRGLNARVIEPGAVAVGDRLVKL